MEKSKSKWKGTSEEHEELRVLAAKLAAMMRPQAKELGKILEDDHDIAVPSDVIVDTTEILVEEKEQTEFTVHLKHFGGSKLNVVKKTKELLGLALKESMVLVNSAPVDLIKNISREQAESIKSSLEEIGAEIEIK